jgi:hypothetical protein
MNIDVEQIAA